jgi:hypothetical protein
MSLGYNRKENQCEDLLLRNTEKDTVIEYLCKVIINSDKENDAVHRITSHIAIRSNRVSDVEANGINVYNEFTVTRKDLVELIRETSLVIKSGVYPHVDDALIQYDGFNHELDSKLIPTHATSTRFLLQDTDGELLRVTPGDDVEIKDGYIKPVIRKKVSVQEAVDSITPVTGVFKIDDFTGIPKNFLTVIKE